MNRENLLELNEEVTRYFVEDEVNEVHPSDIIAFNELRSCADLLRMHTRGQLDIQPDYQRNFIWNNAAQGRFIDSLVKQLPIPSICITLDYKTDRRQVVDGLQRISTIIRFLSDDKWRIPNLPDIHPDLAGNSVSSVRKNSPAIIDRVENTTIPVTVLRCDLSRREHEEYIFTIFHRLNTGGATLSNQEIRNCIYSGPLNDMLKKFVVSEVYQAIFPSKSSSYRFLEEEKVLRILALSTVKYKSPLSRFLNTYMSDQRNLNDDELIAIYDRLYQVYDRFRIIVNKDSTTLISNTIAEACLIGLYVNLDFVLSLEDQEVFKRWVKLISSPPLRPDQLKEGLSHTDSLNARIEAAKEAFSS